MNKNSSCKILAELFNPSVCPVCGEVCGGFFEEDTVYFHAGNIEIPSTMCKSCTAFLEKTYRPFLRRVNDFPAVCLFPYNNTAIEALMQHIKISGCKNCCETVGRLLFQVLSELTENSGLTFIPRSYKLHRKYGFDQSELLLQTFVRDNSQVVRHVLFERNKRILQIQKELSKEERLINAERSLRLKKNIEVPKSLVVFDDMITTGATATTAANLLKTAGCEDMIFVFITGTVK